MRAQAERLRDQGVDTGVQAGCQPGNQSQYDLLGRAQGETPLHAFGEGVKCADIRGFHESADWGCRKEGLPYSGQFERLSREMQPEVAGKEQRGYRAVLSAELLSRLEPCRIAQQRPQDSPPQGRACQMQGQTGNGGEKAHAMPPAALASTPALAPCCQRSSRLSTFAALRSYLRRFCISPLCSERYRNHASLMRSSSLAMAQGGGGIFQSGYLFMSVSGR